MDAGAKTTIANNCVQWLPLDVSTETAAKASIIKASTKFRVRFFVRAINCKINPLKTEKKAP
jgi:hypothetical protein